MTQRNIVNSAIQKSSFYCREEIFSNAIRFFTHSMHARSLRPTEYGVTGILVFYISVIQIFVEIQLGTRLNHFSYNSNYKLKPLGLIKSLAMLYAFLLSKFDLEKLASLYKCRMYELVNKFRLPTRTLICGAPSPYRKTKRIKAKPQLGVILKFQPYFNAKTTTKSATVPTISASNKLDIRPTKKRLTNKTVTISNIQILQTLKIHLRPKR